MVKYSEEQVGARMSAFIEEARAGAPDDWLAKHTGLSEASVARWRRAQGIHQQRGRGRQAEVGKWALDLLGTAYNPALHTVGSAVRGLWETPEFVLREPLNYDATCRAVYDLTQLGYDPHTLAGALGLRLKDIELALAIQKEHLESRGTPCTECGDPVDLDYGATCIFCRRTP